MIALPEWIEGAELAKATEELFSVFKSVTSSLAPGEPAAVVEARVYRECVQIWNWKDGIAKFAYATSIPPKFQNLAEWMTPFEPAKWGVTVLKL